MEKRGPSNSRWPPSATIPCFLRLRSLAGGLPGTLAVQQGTRSASAERLPLEIGSGPAEQLAPVAVGNTVRRTICASGTEVGTRGSCSRAQDIPRSSPFPFLTLAQNPSGRFRLLVACGSPAFTVVSSGLWS